jgi:hypothetical protein
VRVALQEEKIVTNHSSGKETENTAKPGDYIIKTSDKDDGYVILADRFFEIYEDDPTKERFYRNKITRIGLLTVEDIAFNTPWGEEQSVLAGGVVIEAGPYIYGVDKFSFIKNYGRTEDSPELNTFVMMDESLEIQLQKAKQLNLKNHIFDIELRIKHQNMFRK